MPSLAFYNKKNKYIFLALSCIIILYLIYSQFYYSIRYKQNLIKFSFLEAEIYHDDVFKMRCQKQNILSNMYKCKADDYVLPNVWIDKQKLAVLLLIKGVEFNKSYDSHIFTICNGKVAVNEDNKKVYCLLHFQERL